MTRPRVFILLLIVGLTAGCATPYIQRTLSPGCAQVLARPAPASLESMGLAPWDAYKLSEAERDARLEYSICQEERRSVQAIPRIYPSGESQPAPYVPTGPVLCVTLAPGMISCTR